MKKIAPCISYDISETLPSLRKHLLRQYWYHINCFLLTPFSLEMSFCAFPSHPTWARCLGKKKDSKKLYLYRTFIVLSLGSKNESSHPVKSQKGDILSKNVCCATLILQKKIEDNRFTSLACCTYANYSKIIYHKGIKGVRIWVIIRNLLIFG